MRQLVVTIALLAVTATTLGCDDPPVDIGMARGASGEILILFDPCEPDYPVRSVEVQSGGSTLWRIETETDSLLREFVVGEAPEGFRTTVPLDRSLEGLRIRATVSDVGPEFLSVADLRQDSVFVVGEGSMSPEEFWARDTC